MTSERIEQVVACFDATRSITQTAKMMQMSRPTVRRIIRERQSYRRTEAWAVVERDGWYYFLRQVGKVWRRESGKMTHAAMTRQIPAVIRAGREKGILRIFLVDGVEKCLDL